MKKFFYLFFLAGCLLGIIGVTSCGGDDNKTNPESGGGSGGGSQSNGQWYIELSSADDKPYTVELEEISIGAALTFGNTPTKPTMGDPNVIHIINDNTLEFYNYANVTDYEPGATGKQLLFRVNTGSLWGMLGYYANNPTTYTYEKIDNKLYVIMKGEIYTVTSSALIRDGGKTYYSYDPESAIYTLSPRVL